MRTIMPKFHKIVIETGCDKPREHDRVVVQLAVQLNGEVKIAGQVLTFDLGHAEDFGAVKFVDHVVETMGLGEQCTVSVPVSVALTESERKQWGVDTCLPQDELFLTFRLHDIQKAKQYVRAFRTYKLGIGFLRGSVIVQPPVSRDTPLTNVPAESNEARQLLVLCFSNAALCLLHLVSLMNASSDVNHTNGVLSDSARQMVLLCVEYCTRATELDPTYAKSWFRLAKSDDEDDEDAIEKLPISVWSNHLAANMMSLHEELEAFGEKMPEPNMSRSSRRGHRTNSRLSTIQDEDSEMGEMV
ncbi:unnamed protein product [Echinostoma caproni]|uniref:Peptidylprolyl isomerase n=1 Tax=Echinostoma caproni TaxID=27848 RepID=A0A183AXX4_9TREM|nr:unnamed protein product [Echinostoma caproni]